MKLLVIDGSNFIMRCAFGGDLPPEQAVPNATSMVKRAIRELGATHLIIALDHPASDGWRKKRYPDYKANRKLDTAPWLTAALEPWLNEQNRVVVTHPNYEADDLIATIIVKRVAGAGMSVYPVSSDSDLLYLTTKTNVFRPVNGGGFQEVDAAWVEVKYGVMPGLLPQLKALAGEDGDNIPGVDSIGPVRAAKLLATYGSINNIIAAGRAETCKLSKLVADSADTVRLALELATLSEDAEIAPIKQNLCKI